MIIDREGKILVTAYLGVGTIVEDGNFSIFLEYSDADKPKGMEIEDLKVKLKDTDYKAIKHFDGLLSDEEYEPTKNQRQAWRDRINELQAEITMPTISEKDMKEAERKAMEYIGQTVA